RLHVDAAVGVDVAERAGRQDFAVRTVDDVEQSVAIGTHRHLARLAGHLKIGEDELVDAVVIAQIVRAGLREPALLAGLRDAREYPRGPEVVAGPLIRVPRSGVRRAVINE